MFVASEGWWGCLSVCVCVCVCVCVKERERRRYRETEKRVRQSVHSEKFHPECLQFAGMKPEYFIWLERAQKKTHKKKKRRKMNKKRLRLQNESVCLKVLHFTWLHPSHSLHMGSVAPVQLGNHVPGKEALKEHSNQQGGHFSPNPQCGCSVSPRTLPKYLS